MSRRHGPTVVYVDVSGSMFQSGIQQKVEQLVAGFKSNPGASFFFVDSSGIHPRATELQGCGSGILTHLVPHIIDGEYTKADSEWDDHWEDDEYRIVFLTDGDLAVDERNALLDLRVEIIDVTQVTPDAKYPRRVQLRCGYVYFGEKGYPAALLARNLEHQLAEQGRKLNDAIDLGRTNQFKANAVGVDIYKTCQRILDDHIEVLDTFPYLRESALSVMQAVGSNLFGFNPEQASKIIRDPAINPNASSPEEDTPMASINTTVTLNVSSTARATLADLKTLITEVERVGGTDESYVDLNQARTSYRFDAIVVAATVQDTRLTDALAITDNDARTKALLALLNTELKDEVVKHLTAAPVKKKA